MLSSGSEYIFFLLLFSLFVFFFLLSSSYVFKEPPSFAWMEGSSDAYRACVQQNLELRKLVGLLAHAVETQIAESSDAAAVEARLRPLLARAATALRSRSKTDPERRRQETSAPLSPAPAPPHPAPPPPPLPPPAAVLAARNQVLPVIPVGLVVLSDPCKDVVLAPEPRASRIVPARSGTPGRSVPRLDLSQPAPTPPPRSDAASPRSATSVTRSPRSWTTERSPRFSLSRLPVVLFGMIVAKLPQDSVLALACCSSAIRDAVTKWKRMANRTNVVLELGKKKKKKKKNGS